MIRQRLYLNLRSSSYCESRHSTEVQWNLVSIARWDISQWSIDTHFNSKRIKDVKDIVL